MKLVEQFEAARPRLLSLAHRILGSHHDAQDAVQTAWIRAQTTDMTTVANPDGWFSTVTARLCLDLLRTRRRRHELPLPPLDIPSEELGADEAFLNRENVSRALLVLLNELSPRQRVAYVLHDLFAVPFDQIATVLDASPTVAKKLASRARTKLRSDQPAEPGHDAAQLEVVEAFLAAARGGDLNRLVELMAPDVVRTADPRLLPPGARTHVHGATAVAQETKTFVDRIAAAVPVLVDGRLGAVIAPGGHAYALIDFQIDAGVITKIAITTYTPGTVSPVDLG